MWIGREQREKEQVKNFVALTGASDDEARHHLEDSGWNSSVALARYQNIDISNRPEVRPTLSATRSQTESPAFMPRSNPAFATVVVDETPAKHKQSKRDNRKASSSSSTSKLMTLAELDNFSSDEEDDGVTMKEATAKSESFATRGQNAQFKDEDRQHLISFSGAGYSLSSPTATSSNRSSSPEEETQIIEVNVTFWKKGYSIDNGELRRMSEKKHRDFLRSLNEGILPLELSSRAKSSSRASFKIHLIDRKTETYVPTPSKGRTISDSPSSASASSISSSSSQLGHRDGVSIVVDETQPKTQILVRLASGGTTTLVLNTTHCLRDLFSLVESLSPAPEGKSVQLRLTYPRKVFKNSSESNQDDEAVAVLGTSLESLQLSSSCLIQEFT
eukprot:TRINITY_DN10019_c0_g1_i1.p1 TRINITY_DN10019_c0_g1~~TRINITY_DN10019_c0_g1_i1.p1  ORF type:complete len:389 (+),score=95.67 TRINITY_DN10019_c0_g1_i1:182-1348(+)